MTVKCPACGHESDRIYRCDECDRDLAHTSSTTGGQEGGR